MAGEEFTVSSVKDDISAVKRDIDNELINNVFLKWQ